MLCRTGWGKGGGVVRATGPMSYEGIYKTWEEWVSKEMLCLHLYTGKQPALTIHLIFVSFHSYYSVYSVWCDLMYGS